MANKKKTADKVVKKKTKKRLTAVEVDDLQQSVVDQVRPDSASDIGGRSGLINTGPVVSYKSE